MATRRRGGVRMTKFHEVPVVWRKSRASAGSNCVEVASVQNCVLIRDSKNPEGGVLQLTFAAWNAFLEYARTSDWDFR